MSLPNFLCIGAPKSGTTSLFEILKQHPEICVSSFKEPHFFDNNINWDKGLAWYEESYFSNVKNNVVGEFTPTYLSNKDSAKRIKDTLSKNVKFIVLLRNPVDRAYSHYLHSKRDELEDLTFIDSLLNEEDRLAKCRGNNDEISFTKYSYIYQGLYSDHIKIYLRYFPIEKFHFVLFDDFLKNRKETINKILKFLNVSTNVDLDLNIFSNKASVARSTILKKFMKKQTIFSKTLKLLIPSLKLRQQIRNLIHSTNNKETSKKPLTLKEKDFCFKNYFSKQISDLEKILNINLDIWKL